MKDVAADELAKLGKRIANARRAAKLSQDRLAERAGLDRSFISRLERGKANATYLTLRKIASALSIELAVLVTDDG